MLLELGRFHSAILFRPMVPFSQTPPASLENLRVLLSGGRFDRIATPGQVQALANLLRDRGAIVDVQMQKSSHELTSADVTVARDWLASGVIA
jgi:phospholipase/carboxylesterase